MAGEPGAAGEQGDLVSRLRAVIGAKDEQIVVLTAALEAALERERRLELRLAEVERQLRQARLITAHGPVDLDLIVSRRVTRTA